MTGDDPDMAAAELALGVLDGAERAGALRRIIAEPGFAAEAAWWREELGALFETVPEVPAPAGMFERIDRSLHAPATVVRRQWIWPSVAGLTSLAAAAMLALMLLRPAPMPVPESVSVAPRAHALLAAAITPTDAGTPLSAVYDPAAGLLRVSAATLAGRGRSAELWVIGGDGVPHSLGLLRGGDVTALPVAPADRARLAAAAVLAVSIEQPGGSPTGSPIGPVVAKGTLART